MVRHRPLVEGRPALLKTRGYGQTLGFICSAGGARVAKRPPRSACACGLRSVHPGNAM